MASWVDKSTLLGQIKEIQKLVRLDSLLVRQEGSVTNDDYEFHYYNALEYISSYIQKLEVYLSGKKDDLQALSMLTCVVNSFRDAPPVRTTADRFRMLAPLRWLLLWLPTRFLPRIRYDPSKIVLTAYVYGVSLVLAPVFANLGAAYFRFMSIDPILASYDRLLLLSRSKDCGTDAKEAFRLMDFPLAAVHNFQTRIGIIQNQTQIHVVLQHVPIGLDPDSAPEFSEYLGDSSFAEEVV
jgi:hypothetical protein